jgi:hypothetical protein
MGVRMMFNFVDQLNGGLLTFPLEEDLLQCLVNVLMWWVLGSQPPAVEGYMHDTIAMGVGHLNMDILDSDMRTMPIRSESNQINTIKQKKSKKCEVQVNPSC